MNTRIPAASEYENFSLDATGILVTAHQPQTRPSCSLPRSPTRIAGKGNTPACHQPAPKTTEMTDGQTHDDDRMLHPNLQYPTKLQAKAASWNPPPVQRRIGFFPHLANSPRRLRRTAGGFLFRKPPAVLTAALFYSKTTVVLDSHFIQYSRNRQSNGYRACTSAVRWL